MTAAQQRMADLERQVAELRTEMETLRDTAFKLSTLEEMMLRHRMGGGVPAAPPVRPRHLVALDGGVR